MKTILVIEDDRTLLEGLQIYLEMEGFRTLTSANGERGLALARGHRPDIVLTNYQMPGADGLKVIRELRSDPTLAGTPVIFITANHQLSVREQALQGGADAFLRKPFSTNDLMEKINELLYSHLEKH